MAFCFINDFKKLELRNLICSRQVGKFDSHECMTSLRLTEKFKCQSFLIYFLFRGTELSNKCNFMCTHTYVGSNNKWKLGEPA